MLDDRLGLLAWRVDRGLKHQLQFLPVLRTDAVPSALPAGLVQQLVCLGDIELPRRVLRDEALRVVDEVSGCAAGAPVDMRLHRSAIDEQTECPAHSGIAEQRVLCLQTRAFAVDLGQRIGVVELDMLDIAARRDLDSASGAASGFQPEEALVLDLHVPCIVVFAGLDDRARRRDRIAAALHLDRVEMRPVRQVISGAALAFDQVAWLKVNKAIGAGAHGFEVGRCVA